MRVSRPALRSQYGVTLLENMVALLILSVGLLGMAGLQVYTLRGESSTTFRMRAMQQAQDIADRMRSNIAAIYSDSSGTTPYNAVSPNAIPVSPDCSGSACTPTQLAAYDIAQWQALNSELLPGKAGVVGGYIVGAPLTAAGANIPLFQTAAAPNRMRFTIFIVWDGERTGSALPPDCLAGGSSASPLSCYTLEVDL